MPNPPTARVCCARTAHTSFSPRSSLTRYKQARHEPRHPRERQAMADHRFCLYAAPNAKALCILPGVLYRAAMNFWLSFPRHRHPRSCVPSARSSHAHIETGARDIHDAAALLNRPLLPAAAGGIPDQHRPVRLLQCQATRVDADHRLAAFGTFRLHGNILRSPFSPRSSVIHRASEPLHFASFVSPERSMHRSRALSGLRFFVSAG